MRDIFLNSKEALGARIVFYLVFVYISLFCLLQFNYYNYFDYAGFDLAIYNQVTWNTLHGNFFNSSIRGGIYFKDHIPLILLLLIPAYSLFQSPLTLLFLQTIALGFSAWPLFLLARDKLEIKYCISFVVLYLINPAVGWLNADEFHADALSPFFLLFTFYYFTKSNFRLFLLFMIFSMFCKEDVSLVVAMFGFYAAIRRKSMRWILAPLIGGIGWFALSIFMVIPYFNKGEYLYTVFYAHLGNGFPEIFRTLITRPGVVFKTIFTVNKLVYLGQLFGPVSFASFFSPLELSLVVPTILRNLLTNYPPTFSIYHQYSAALLPFIFVSAVYGFKRVKKYPNIIMALILAVGLVSSWKMAPQLHLIRSILAYRPDYCDYIRKKFIAAVPRNVSVIATFDFLPRLSCREKVYTFHYVYFGREKVEKKRFVIPEDLEYALVDFNDLQTFILFYTAKGAENMRRFFEQGNWGVVRVMEDIVLFRRNHQSEYKLYESIRHPVIQNKRNVVIDGRLAFLGYDSRKIEIDKDPVLCLSLYWKCLQGKLPDYLLAVEILDKEGRVLLYKNQSPTYHIYPTSQWRAQEIVKCNYWLLFPFKDPLSDYRIKVTLFDKNGHGQAVSSFTLES